MFSPPWFAGIYRIGKEAKSNGLASPPKLLKLRPNLAGASLFSLPRERNVLRGPYYEAPALSLLYHTARRSGRRGRGAHGHSTTSGPARPFLKRALIALLQSVRAVRLDPAKLYGVPTSPGAEAMATASGTQLPSIPPPHEGRGLLVVRPNPGPFLFRGSAPVQSPKPTHGLPLARFRIIPDEMPIPSGARPGRSGPGLTTP